jgi:Bacterial Alpha-2-macroglobulin MG10 domain/Alpha-2-macroglobulin family/MG2 domain
MRLIKQVVAICLCVGFGSLYAQQGVTDYDKKWDKVDSLLGKVGLPVSALVEVDRIEAMALQEKNSAQELKALVYRISIEEQKNDGSDTVATHLIEKRIAHAVQPARSILESMLARLYWRYLQQNRYRLYTLTSTAEVNKPDIGTWTVDDLHRRIAELFLASLKEEGLLQQTGLKDWEPILIKGNSRALRPTLYDVLAHEAIDYFKSTEASINVPGDLFTIDDTVVFAEPKVFAGHAFAVTDTASPHYHALVLYQRLLQFHLGDARPDALIDADVDRLNFADNFSASWNKNDQYTRALKRLTARWGDHPAAAQGWFLLAKGDTDLVRAKEICDRVLREPDSSEGKSNCRSLLSQIIQPGLTLEVERFNLPNKPFRCLVTWSNVRHLYIHISKLDSSLSNASRGNDNEWFIALHAPVFRSLTFDLPDGGDYTKHVTEIAIGSLPAGSYCLLSTTDSNWNVQSETLTQQRFYVSSIAYLKEGLDYFVVNRETGAPLNDTRVQAWANVRINDGTWQRVKREIYHTDQHGHFQVRKRTGYEAYFFEFTRPGEDLFMDDAEGPYIYGSEVTVRTSNKEEYENKNTQVWFFTDRSIYRPGQTVYFKGISVTRDFDTRQLRPAAARTGTVILFNANREKLDSVRLTTDEFGSYHGSFSLPKHGLNGSYEIVDFIGASFPHEFQVEEYKRPRFLVSFDPLKGSYRVGDRIEVKGNVRAYAGNNLDGAKVKYRITRMARYPWYLRSMQALPSGSQEILHGEVNTDGNGEFRLVFQAAADRSVPATSDPRFDYTISAEVTDINGETRSGSTTIVAGYTTLDVSIGLGRDEAMAADSLRSILVDITNLSGERVSSVVRVAAYPLKSPNRIVRARLWATTPDRWVMTEHAFLDSFPQDPYRDELNKEHWPRGAAAWEGIDSTGGHPLPLRLAPGWWAIEAITTDRFGQTTKDLRYIELDDTKTGAPPSPMYLWATSPITRTGGKPGESVRVVTGSSAKDIFIVREINRPIPVFQGIYGPTDQTADKDSLRFRYIMSSEGNNVENWALTEGDRGGIGIADAFVKDNRVYVHRTLVDVPWYNKDLHVRYTSFRDKTEPGSVEKWAVNISAYQGSPATAQVLAGLYDASLDQFMGHSWATPYLYPRVAGAYSWQNIDDFTSSWSRALAMQPVSTVRWAKRYDELREIGALYDYRYSFRGNHFKMPAPMAAAQSDNLMLHDTSTSDSILINAGGKDIISQQPPIQVSQPVQVRSNFNETAFFFPDLRTDSMGNVSFSFTMPESLTQWKWMTLAHTRDLAFGYSEKTIVTQKQLMVQPNAPRFLREGDKINLAVKVVNMTDSEMTGQLGLALTDPTTGETADGWFVNRQPNQYFTVAARGSAVVEFPLDIPYQYNRPVSYRIVAEAGAYSDGEESILPVVSNRMLVTETLPLNMPGDGVRNFKFDKLLRSGSSETLSHHALTVEFTANPAWYAVEALPYLMEYPYECAEQTFDRLYANAVASRIVSGSPRIAQVFVRWRTADTSALLSTLEKNPELKSVLLEETPWVMEGKTETQQKRNIALLFDMVRMSRELESTVDRLSELQAADGGFPWFKGGMNDRFVTQYILTGLGRIERMHALSTALTEKVRKIIKAALADVDREILVDYQRDLKVKDGVHWIAPFAAQYLYMRSLFNDYGISGTALPAVSYYRKLAQQDWVKTSKYIQGMLALALYRTGDVQTARSILASLRETAIRDPERGMYWKGMEGGYYWYQAPVETEALLIEAFREVGHDSAADRGLKTWLLRQKQTHRWATTKATADACYALLSGSEDWLDQQRDVKVQLGEKTADLSGGEAGTGYANKIFDAPFINPGMGNIKVTMTSAKGGGSGGGAKGGSGSPAWGAVYWQYFDQLDQITAAGGSGSGTGQAALRVSKRLYVQRNTDRGPVLDTIPDNGTLRVGDRVVARITLRSDRGFEFVHLKDMRGACFEPLNVLSGFEWQGGLGYYETTRDVSTEFFFSWVPKGVYVFDYSMVVGQTGEFSNGVTSVECLYAPEFANHTEGIRINAEGGQ